MISYLCGCHPIQKCFSYHVCPSSSCLPRNLENSSSLKRNQSNSSMNNGLEWRRNKVLELLSKGKSQTDISNAQSWFINY